MFQKRRNLQYSQIVVNTACKKLVADPCLLLTKVLFSPLCFRNDIFKKCRTLRHSWTAINTTCEKIEKLWAPPCLQFANIFLTFFTYKIDILKKGKNLAIFTDRSKYHMREAYGISLPAADDSTFSHPSHSKSKFSVCVLS